ncbi:MAG: NUDIX hydrolase [Firmicutes bacterium]|nr:NUDIX hydrolase [Bacillota bacterium]
MSDYIKELRSLIGNRPIIIVGATILVRNLEEILLQRRSDTGTWGLPGGSLELGESLEQAARRELIEETGLRAGELKLVNVFSGPEFFFVYPNGDQVHTVIVLFEASKVSGVLAPIDDESLELKYFPLNALPELESRAENILKTL